MVAEEKEQRKQHQGCAHKKQTEITSSKNITSEGSYLKPGPLVRANSFFTMVEGDSFTAEFRSCLEWFKKLSKAGAALL